MCCAVYITAISSVHKEMLYGNKEQKKLQLCRGNALKALERVEDINKQMEGENELEDEP
jgi:hypothetical protein